MATPHVLSAAGASAPVVIVNKKLMEAWFLPPSILCLVNGTLTYNIEVTGDSPDMTGALPSSPVWFPLDSTTIGLTTSINETLAALVTGVRINVTSYTSGSITFEVVQ